KGKVMGMVVVTVEAEKEIITKVQATIMVLTMALELDLEWVWGLVSVWEQVEQSSQPNNVTSTIPRNSKIYHCPSLSYFHASNQPCSQLFVIVS
ncbi:hypothetical protein VIGAN_05084500, partial [Vigna angularis var. angularis]